MRETVAPWRVPEPGFYGCVKTRGFWPLVVRIVTRSWANHVFIVVGDNQVVEAEPGGVRFCDINEYVGCRVAYNDTEPMTDAQRVAVVTFAENLRGEAYDWTADGMDGLVALGLKWRILARVPKVRRSVMCSELVALAGRAAGLDWLCGQTIAAQVTPAMLAARIDKQVWQGTK